MIELKRMKKEVKDVVEGVVLEALPNMQFKVEVPEKREMLCHLSGKMRINHIRVMPGDTVRVELTPFDEKRGRIIYRVK